MRAGRPAFAADQLRLFGGWLGGGEGCFVVSGSERCTDAGVVSGGRCGVRGGGAFAGR